jgi:glucosyl-3-phosphoglycerate phosphatase
MECDRSGSRAHRRPTRRGGQRAGRADGRGAGLARPVPALDQRSRSSPADRGVSGEVDGSDRFPEEYDAWVKGDTARIVVLGEETSDEVRGRITSAFWDYFGSLSPGETGIAVTHGGCLRLGVSELLGWSDGQWRSLRVLDNGAWAVLSQTGDMLPRLSAYNLTAADHGFPRRSSDFALE